MYGHDYELTEKEEWQIIEFTRPDLYGWAKYFFPHYLTDPPSLMHRWMVRRLQEQHLSRGCKTAIVAPRSGAKTTWISKLYPLYLIAEELESYLLIVSDTLGQAKKILASIKHEIEENSELAKYYPRLAGKGTVWNTTELQTRTGIRVEVMGAGTSSRGSTFRNHRPTLIVIDDLLNDDAARSETQRENLWEWFTRALMHMGTRESNVYFVGTALHRDDALQRLKKTPGWQFHEFKSLIREPLRQDLWDEWKRIHNDPLNKQRDAQSLAYYRANEPEMLRGSLVLWPERESIYDLMVFRQTSESSFQSEKQGNPTAASKAEWSDTCFPAGIWFTDWPKMRIKVCALDPSKGKTDTSDYSAIVSIGLGYDGLIYIDADMERRDTTTMVEDCIGVYRSFEPVLFLVEINQFQELLINEFARRARELGIIIPTGSVQNTTNKDTRIRMIGPYLRNGILRFKSNSRGASILVEQLREFPFGSHDDGPDALQMAIEGLRHITASEQNNTPETECYT